MHQTEHSLKWKRRHTETVNRLYTVVQTGKLSWRIIADPHDFWAISQTKHSIRANGPYTSSKSLDQLLRKIHKLEYVWGQKLKAR